MFHRTHKTRLAAHFALHISLLISKLKLSKFCQKIFYSKYKDFLWCQLIAIIFFIYKCSCEEQQLEGNKEQEQLFLLSLQVWVYVGGEGVTRVYYWKSMQIMDLNIRSC